MSNPIVEQKLKTVAEKQNVLPSAIGDFVTLRAHDFHVAADGKVRETTSGRSVKKVLKGLRETKPFMFGGPPTKKVGSNPWKAGDSDEAQAARLHVIKTSGTKVAQALAAQAGTDLAGRKLRTA